MTTESSGRVAKRRILSDGYAEWPMHKCGNRSIQSTFATVHCAPFPKSSNRSAFSMIFNLVGPCSWDGLDSRNQLPKAIVVKFSDGQHNADRWSLVCIRRRPT